MGEAVTARRRDESLLISCRRVQYFKTNIRGAGIFLPLHRAEKRFSPDSPATPGTPSYSSMNGKSAYTPPTPANPVSKFSQSVGPGARPTSPTLKAKRPSLPRPESPFRKAPPSLAPTPGRNLSQSVRGGRPPGLSTATPSKPNFRASTTTSRPAASQTPRPYSRTGSRLGNRQETIEEDERSFRASTNGRTTSNGSVPSFSQPLRSPSRLGSAGGSEAKDQEIQRLRRELAEKEKSLEEQAVQLSEMDASVKELSALIPADGTTPGGSARRSSLGEDDEQQSAAQLRQLLREKNEKISIMTAEFDSHRADFRSTLDSLEMASTETERVYEEQKTDLLAQLEQLQRQNVQMAEELAAGGGGGAAGKEDFDSIVRQLKGLEELVAELEEGLEESRRGEAEARGEVEFLRGEVERGRSELRREREKAAEMQANGSSNDTSSKELEQKDDEIRGLKALIHGLSSSPSAPQSGAIAGLDEVKKLQAALDESRHEKEMLEEQLEQLRRDAATHGHTRHDSERTATTSDVDRPEPVRQRSGTIKPTFAEHAKRAGMSNGMPQPTEDDDAPVDGVYCEMCESKDHDTLDCTKLTGSSTSPGKSLPSAPQQEHTPGKENRNASAKPSADEDKWCALCEEDGHLAYDCPKEQY